MTGQLPARLGGCFAGALGVPRGTLAAAAEGFRWPIGSARLKVPDTSLRTPRAARPLWPGRSSAKVPSAPRPRCQTPRSGRGDSRRRSTWNVDDGLPVHRDARSRCQTPRYGRSFREPLWPGRSSAKVPRRLSIVSGGRTEAKHRELPPQGASGREADLVPRSVTALVRVPRAAPPPSAPSRGARHLVADTSLQDTSLQRCKDTSSRTLVASAPISPGAA